MTISFKQAIKATDALRTGAYSRTLTFTLSTTHAVRGPRMTLRPSILAAAVIVAGGLPALASAAPGDLDVSFSGDGKQTTDFGGADLASAVAVQADGKLVVAGTSDGNFALARYGVDGALDPSFSGDGLVTTDIGGTDDGQGVVIQPDGKIVVAGGSEGNFALARYTTGGGLDPSFSGDGCDDRPSALKTARPRWRSRPTAGS